MHAEKIDLDRLADTLDANPTATAEPLRGGLDMFRLADGSILIAGAPMSGGLLITT